MDSKDGLLVLIGDLYATNNQLRALLDEARAELMKIVEDQGKKEPGMGFDTDGDGDAG